MTLFISPVSFTSYAVGSLLAELPFYEWETFALDQMWLFIPLQAAIKDFLTTIPQYPFQMGSSLSASNINYDLFRRAGAMERLKSLQKQLEDLGAGAH